MTELVGYARKGKNGDRITLSLSVEMMESVARVPGSFNAENDYLHLQINIQDIVDVLDGEKTAIPIFAFEEEPEGEKKTETFIVHDNNQGPSGA